MATIQIADLKLKTVIGTNDWERKRRQTVLINVTFTYNAHRAKRNDSLKMAVDYKAITKKIIKGVQTSRFFLLETLADFVLKIVMENKKVTQATVRIDKPLALRFAKSVSAEVSTRRIR